MAVMPKIISVLSQNEAKLMYNVTNLLTQNAITQKSNTF